MRTVAIIFSAIVGVSFLSLPAVAQQKTVKACQTEWRANKDANQAKGITEKAYVAPPRLRPLRLLRPRRRKRQRLPEIKRRPRHAAMNGGRTKTPIRQRA
jgi:hypothetical protein